jgi:hypothetical protein
MDFIIKKNQVLLLKGYGTIIDEVQEGITQIKRLQKKFAILECQELESIFPQIFLLRKMQFTVFE